MMAPIEQLNAPINNVAQPGLSILQTNQIRYKNYYKKILFLIGFATLPTGIFTILYAKEIILVVLGEKWLGSVIFLKVFGVAAAIRPVVGTSGVVLITCGRSGKLLIVSLVHSVVLVIFMFIGIKWGAVGIAIAHVSTSVILMVPKLVFSFYGTPISTKDFFYALLKPFFSATLMSFILILFKISFYFTYTMQSLFIGFGVASTSYLMIYMILPGGVSEIKYIIDCFTVALNKHSKVTNIS